METRPFGISVTVSFPPDTDTPCFEMEEKGKPEETKIISQTAGLMQPETVAQSMLDDALAGHFMSSPGMDGWMLTNLNAGMTDSTVGRMLVQFSLLGLLRLVGWFYQQYFIRVINGCKKKRQAGKKIS